jgi:hypothetical protein
LPAAPSNWNGGTSLRRKQVNRMVWIVGAGRQVLTRAAGAVADSALNRDTGMFFDLLDGGQQL